MNGQEEENAGEIKMENEEHMDRIYKKVIADKGEGIMLKHPQSPYEGKRSKYLLKYKPAFDAEAIIIDYRMGEGKYKGLLGALICKQLINHDTYSSIDENEDPIFSISGMDDTVRKSYKKTHPIGTIISYEHSGKTDKGKPRFGRYTRIRTDITIQEHIQEPIEETKSNLGVSEIDFSLLSFDFLFSPPLTLFLLHVSCVCVDTFRTFSLLFLLLHFRTFSLLFRLPNVQLPSLLGAFPSLVGLLCIFALVLQALP